MCVCVCVSAGDTQRAAVAIFVLPPEIIIYTHRDDTAFVRTVSEATDINFIILNLSRDESNTAVTEKQATQNELSYCAPPLSFHTSFFIRPRWLTPSTSNIVAAIQACSD